MIQYKKFDRWGLASLQKGSPGLLPPSSHNLQNSDIEKQEARETDQEFEVRFLRPTSRERNLLKHQVAERVAATNAETETRGSRLQGFIFSLLASFGGAFTQNHEQERSEMALRAAIPQQREIKEVKQKNVLGDGKNRRVLQDIGNFVTERAAQPGKKPITEAAAVNGVAIGKVGAVIKPAVRKVAQKPKPIAEPQEVIVISSDESEKGRRVSRRRPTEESSRKEVKTLTAILTARSKAASGLGNKPWDPLVDIDAADVYSELAVTEYVDDIYKFYKLTEDEGRVHDYMDSQPDINSRMRSILVDWLIEVHRKFELMPETLYLTINVVDRFLSVTTVSRRELQLVGISSMLIACKYEEIWAPEVNDFVCISDNAYVREQVLAMEKAILGQLQWHLTVPTPYVFLVRYIKASVPSDKEMEHMVFFFAELGLTQYPTVILYCPSMIAASAVYAARCTLERSPFWSETLRHHTGYQEDQLMDCAQLLVKFHASAAENKLKAVYRKFSSPDHSAVSLFSPAKALLVSS